MKSLRCVSVVVVLAAGLTVAGVAGCAGKEGVKSAAATEGAGAAPAATQKYYDARVSSKSVIYVVDGSAAVGDLFEALKKEMVRSVNGMLPIERFDVVMVGEKDEAVFAGMEKATPDMKKEFAGKVEGMKAAGEIGGKLGPFQEGFEKAMGMRPDVVYFLTAAGFDPKLVEVVAGLNKDHQVRVNGLGYGREDEKRDELLREMAKENGGMFKFISGKEEGKKE